MAAPTSDGLLVSAGTREIGPGVSELTLRVHNTSAHALHVRELTAGRLQLAPAEWTASWFASAWGAEFQPLSAAVDDGFALEVRSGRSSHGAHPWLALTSDLGAVVVVPAWSGNWRISVDAGGRVAAGVEPWRAGLRLQGGETIDVPSVVVAVGEDVDGASVALQRAVRDGWLARSVAADAAPTEWNHWWPYEDVDVDERVIDANAALAVQAGIEVVTVDAGWFGSADAASDWRHQRGDWTEVNTTRFPSGLEALGRSVRRRGAQLGIWVEAEALGRDAHARRLRPDAVALGAADGSFEQGITVSLDEEDPRFLGALCLGSPAGRDLAAQALDRTVRATGARWLKLDFNVDLGAGCTRTDHGHSADDGLFRHYLGLYAVLDEFRAAHPEVVVEACSSGGLRIDLGLARHVHAFFLSDLDHTEHHLRVLSGAARMLPPLAILHWSHSQWRGDHPDQQVDWERLPASRFDAMLRAAMLHRFGVSLALPGLRQDLRDRLRSHVDVFREYVAPLLPGAVLHPLTSTPAAAGTGERAPAFHLADEQSDRHVLMRLVLDGAERPVRMSTPYLDQDRRYRIVDPFTGQCTSATGSSIGLEGIALAGPADAMSWLLVLEPDDQEESG